ncbi:hypothetical protein U1Q18_024585 [Sarracenia purpurea var. burkii]
MEKKGKGILRVSERKRVKKKGLPSLSSNNAKLRHRPTGTPPSSIYHHPPLDYPWHIRPSINTTGPPPLSVNP